MTSIPTTSETPADVKAILDRLKRRIRAYVWLDGLSLALLWIGVTFWIAMALDYVPVAMGLSDLPWQARVVMLAIITVVLGLIFYHWIFKRILVRLTDTNMALLLERQYTEFDDALLTAVQLGDRSPDPQQDNFDQSMLERTSELAAEHIPQVKLNTVFRTRPLILKWIAAGFAIGIGADFCDALWQLVPIGRGAHLFSRKRTLAARLLR